MNTNVQIIVGYLIIAVCAVFGFMGGIMVKNGYDKKKEIQVTAQTPNGKSKDKEEKINVTSHNQSGGITAYNVNIGAQPRKFNKQLAESLDSLLLPYQGKSVALRVTMGDQEAINLATEIKKYLESKGWKISVFKHVVPIKSIQPGLSYKETAQGDIELTIGPK